MCHRVLPAAAIPDDYDMGAPVEGAGAGTDGENYASLQSPADGRFLWPVMEAGGSVDPEILDFFYKGLFILAEDWEADLLLSSVMEMGKVNLGCMEAFGKADIL